MSESYLEKIAQVIALRGAGKSWAAIAREVHWSWQKCRSAYETRRASQGSLVENPEFSALFERAASAKFIHRFPMLEHVRKQEAPDDAR